MAGEITGNIPKPQLRGLHQASVKKNLVVAGVLMAISLVVIKFGRNDPRKQDYADFYKTYDDNKVYQRMKENGLLQSAPQ